MTREVYVGVLKSVRAQLRLAADALDMCGTCGVDGATGNEIGRRLRLSAAVRQCILMLELDIEAPGCLAADGGPDGRRNLNPAGGHGSPRKEKGKRLSGSVARTRAASRMRAAHAPRPTGELATSGDGVERHALISPKGSRGTAKTTKQSPGTQTRFGRPARQKPATSYRQRKRKDET